MATTKQIQILGGLQGNWEQADITAPDYIKNKPDLGAIPGKKLPNNIEIFNDYENNETNIPFAHISGNSNTANIYGIQVIEVNAENHTIKVDNVTNLVIGDRLSFFKHVDDEGYYKYRAKIGDINVTNNILTIVDDGEDCTELLTDLSVPIGELSTDIGAGYWLIPINSSYIGTTLTVEHDNSFSATVSGSKNKAGLWATVSGYKNEALGVASDVSGWKNKGIGERSRISGYSNTVTANEACADGIYNEIEGYAGSARGGRNKVRGQAADASAWGNEANGDQSRSGAGMYNKSNGVNADSKGNFTEANGINSSTEGHGTYAGSDNQHVEGTFNTKDDDKKFIHIEGNGTSENDRSTAYATGWDGNGYYSGKVYANTTFGENEDPAGDELAIIGTKPSSGYVSNNDSFPNTIYGAKQHADQVRSHITSDLNKNYLNAQGVKNEIAKVVNSAPETLNTLKELADALGNDENFAATVATQIADKADKTEVADIAFEADTKISLHVRLIENMSITQEVSFDDDGTLTTQIDNQFADIDFAVNVPYFSVEEEEYVVRDVTVTKGAYTSTLTGKTDYLPSFENGEPSVFAGQCVYIKDTIIERVERIENTLNDITETRPVYGFRVISAVNDTDSPIAETTDDGTIYRQAIYTLDSIQGIKVGDLWDIILENTLDAEGGKYRGFVLAVDSANNAVTLDAEASIAIAKNHAIRNLNSNALQDAFIVAGGTVGSFVVDTTGFDVKMNVDGVDCVAGIYASAEGLSTKAFGTASHTEGRSSEAMGERGHAEGFFTKALGHESHAEGERSESHGKTSHAEGYKTKSIGRYSHAEGQEVVSEGEGSHAEGYKTKSIGIGSHVEGVEAIAEGTGTHAEGRYTHAIGEGSHVEGSETKSIGWHTHAEGLRTVALGDRSHAEGFGSEVATGATLEELTTEWETNKEISFAGGVGAHSEGANTIAIGNASHSEGYKTKAGGLYSHTEGDNTIASSRSQHVQGKFNIEDDDNIYAHIIGNGEDNNSRSNAHTVDWDGNAWFAGEVKSGNGVLVTETVLNDMIGKIANSQIIEIGAIYSMGGFWIDGGAVATDLTDEEFHALNYIYFKYDGREIMLKASDFSEAMSSVSVNWDYYYMYGGNDFDFYTIDSSKIDSGTCYTTIINDIDSRIEESLTDVIEPIINTIGIDPYPYKIAWIDNGYINENNGSVVAYNAWKYTDFIEIGDNVKTLIINTTAPDATIYNAVYNSNKEFIENFNTKQNYEVYGTDARYFRLSVQFNHNVSVGKQTILSSEVPVTNIVALNRDVEPFVIQASSSRANAFGDTEPFTFVHFSDIHTRQPLWNRIVEYCNYYREYIDCAIHSGDYCGSHQGKYIDLYSNGITPQIPIYNCVGNHDVFSDTAGTVNTNKQTAYDLLFNHTDGWDVTFADNISNPMTYYKSFTDQNIRVIVLDNYYDIDEQCTWLTNVLNEAKDNGEHVITIMHEVSNPLTNKLDSSFNTIDDYESKGGNASTSNFEQIIADWKASGGIHVANFVGHEHVDMIGYTDNGVLNIAVESATDDPTWIDGKRIENTKTWDCFNVVSVETTTGVLKIVRVGNNSDHNLREKKTLTYDYINNRMVHVDVSQSYVDKVIGELLQRIEALEGNV